MSKTNENTKLREHVPVSRTMTSTFVRPVASVLMRSEKAYGVIVIRTRPFTRMLDVP